MSSISLFFVLVGVSAVTLNLMRLIVWLDTPKNKPPRLKKNAVEFLATERDVAELSLNRAYWAA